MIEGVLTWVNSKDMHLEVAFDKAAVANDTLVVLSAIGFTQDIKAIRAGLNSQLTATIKLQRGERVVKTSCGKQGYATYSYLLGYDTRHAIYISRQSGLILNESDDALWYELCPPPSATRPSRYQTPLLRQWVPYLRQEMVELKLLNKCQCLECEVYQCIANTKDLDDIVSAGLKMGEIKIEEEAA